MSSRPPTPVEPLHASRASRRLPPCASALRQALPCALSMARPGQPARDTPCSATRRQSTLRVPFDVHRRAARSWSTAWYICISVAHRLRTESAPTSRQPLRVPDPSHAPGDRLERSGDRSRTRTWRGRPEHPERCRRPRLVASVQRSARLIPVERAAGAAYSARSRTQVPRPPTGSCSRAVSARRPRDRRPCRVARSRNIDACAWPRRSLDGDAPNVCQRRARISPESACRLAVRGPAMPATFTPDPPRDLQAALLRASEAPPVRGSLPVDRPVMRVSAARFLAERPGQSASAARSAVPIVELLVTRQARYDCLAVGPGRRRQRRTTPAVQAPDRGATAAVPHDMRRARSGSNHLHRAPPHDHSRRGTSGLRIPSPLSQQPRTPRPGVGRGRPS